VTLFSLSIIFEANFRANGRSIIAIGGPITRLIHRFPSHIARKFGLVPIRDRVMTNDNTVAIIGLIIKPET